jgi:hypothetical protein
MDSVMGDLTLSDDLPDEWLEEIGALLAEALMRLRRGKSSAFAGEFGESSLHISPDQSGDAPPCSPEAFHD